MDYATDYEEWLLKYSKAKESLLNGVNKEEITSDATNKEHVQDLVATMMIVRAGRLGSLQCALMEEESPPNAKLLQEFYQFTKGEMENDPSMEVEMKALEAFLPNLNDISTTLQAAALPEVEVDVDAFFDEYPECLRETCNESDTDDSDDDDDSTEYRPVPIDADKQKSNRKSNSSSESNTVRDMRRDTTSMNQFIVNNGDPRQAISQVQRQQEFNVNNADSQHAISQGQQHEQIPQRETSTKAPPSNGDAVAPIENPYGRTTLRKQAPTSVDAPNYSAPRHPNNARGPTPHAPISKQQSWEDLRNQNNPFQSAREYGQHAPPIADHDDYYESQNHAPPVAPSFGVARNPYGNNNTEPRSDELHQPDATNRGQPIRDSLKRKFQPPKRSAVNETKAKASSGETGARDCKQTESSGASSRPSSKGNDNDELPEQLKGLDKDLVEKIQNEIMESGESVTFGDIAGLKDAKQTIFEVVCWPMKRPDLFTGLRRAPNGLLLYGPPGTGKTLIGKAIAHESGATFFSISSSSLTSKWIGEGEKLVRTLFAVAAYREPAVVFIDEIDSLLTQRKADENEASRRIKTEFLVQLDGTGTSGQGRVLIIGATNRPQELDEAARRRFVKRLYIPLPARPDREALIRVLLDKNNHCLTDEETQKLAEDTRGFSGADLKSLCTDAAMGPIRELGQKALEISPSDVPPIAYKHFRRALRTTKPSVAPADLVQYEEWDKLYGSRNISPDDDDDDD